MVYGKCNPGSKLTEADVIDIISSGTPQELYRGKRVLVLTPDATRTCPLPMLVRTVNDIIGHQCVQLDFMVALGTHPVMSESEILALYGIDGRQRQSKFKRSSFFCHRWDISETFQRLGFLEADEVARFSGGAVERTGSRRYQPEHIRIRPNRHHRPCFSPRSRGVLRRCQISVSGYFGRRISPFFSLAGCGDHLRENNRDTRYAGASCHSPSHAPGACAIALPGYGGGIAARPLRSVCR